jgi:capsular exopolysaccharide synthesis family protein
MAQAGRRVLVIDADFHKPTQHRIFSTGREKGLSSVLTGQEPLEKVVCHTAVDGLDLLPAGPTPPNPAELLNSDAFVKFLAVASGLYDQVIIDSPPVMALTDARIMGAVCKNTILVLRAEKSTRRAAHQSCEALASVGASVLGVVVNAVPHRKDRYYYGGYRYHRYGYRYGYGREVPKNDEDAVSVEGGAK